MSLIKLSCKSCGAKLELTDDIDRFSCAHCGSEWIVNKSGGIVSLKAVEESVKHIEKSSQATAEHTEILANEIRKGKIEKRLVDLYQEKLRLQRNLRIIGSPMKRNPEYDKAKEEHDRVVNTKAWIFTNYTSLKIAMIVVILAVFFRKRILSFIFGTNVNSLDLHIIFYIVLFLVIYFSSISILSFVTKAPKIPSFKLDEFIPAPEEKEKDLDRIEEIDNEITELKSKFHEIENKI